MTPRKWIAVLAVAALASAARADDREWEDQAGGWQEAPSDYDVSVDLNGTVTFDSFHGSLAPYGEWVVAGGYGRVWRPRVAEGWRPYYYGRWEWTNEGWFWVSDEPWGWAAYHYGRWAWDSYYGWVWVPGYEWAPAWVSWRVSGDVVGWAPLAPGLSVYVTTYPFVDFWWTFVPTVQFVSTPVYTVAYAPAYARRWYTHTAPAPARPAPRPAPGRISPAPSPAWGGPAPRLVSERIGRSLSPARIVAAPAPGGRARPGEILVYRPEARPAARANPGRGQGVAPAPGRAYQREGFAPPRAESFAPRGQGEGRGPGVAPAPGWSGRGRSDETRPGRSAPPPAAAPAWRPAEPRGGGSPPPAAPAYRGNSGNSGGGGSPPPAAAPAPANRGNGGNGDGGRGGHGGGNRGGGERHAPAPPRVR